MSTDFKAVYDFLYRHDYLAHHGVLGMHWGVRHEKPTHPRQPSGSSSTSEHEKAVLAAAGANKHSEAYLKDRYGPPEKKNGLSEGQKKALLGAGIGLAAIGLIGAEIATRKLNANMVRGLVAQTQNLMRKGKKPAVKSAFDEFLDVSNHAKFRNYAEIDPSKLKTEAIKLDVGSILKRVSTEKETAIRPDGFFATFKDEDVNRYKAVLPIYWKQWGKNSENGFVVHLKANTKISAPSEKEAFEIFRDSLKDVVDGEDYFGAPSTRTLRDHLSTLTSQFQAQHATDEEFAKQVFGQFSGNWANAIAQEDPAVQHFFKKIMGAGHNALVDTNDAGSIGDSPLRILDGSLFDIAGHEVLDKAGIKAAQDAILALAHAIIALGAAFIGKLLISERR